MLCFASICPHPPIILPEIGKKDVVVTEKTINAMLKLGLLFAQSKPDIVFVISPHAVLLHDRIAIGYGETVIGDFSQFGHSEVTMQFEGDKTIIDKLQKESYKSKIQLEPYAGHNEVVPLDHGAMVPLYYLSKAYEKSFSLVLSSFSDFTIMKHFEYGKVIRKVIDTIDKRIAVIASGDMSHRLKEDGPYGLHPSGPLFDKTFVDLLKVGNIEQILNIKESLLDEAGECGFRSFVTLLGILDGSDYTPEILSYEGPWGVGYLVSHFKLHTS